MSDHALEPMQLRFCQEYIIDCVARKAAIRAGYSIATADSSASRMLKDPRIAAKIKELQDERAERIGITADRVLQELAVIAFAKTEDLVITDNDGETDVDLKGLSRDGVKPLSQVSITTTKGRDKIKSINIKTISAQDKMAALVAIAKHLGMFQEKVEVQGNLSLAELVSQSFGPDTKQVVDDTDQRD